MSDLQATLVCTRNNIGPTLTRWAFIMRRTLPDALREGGKRVTRMLIAITPPGNASTGSLTGSADALRVGKAAILTEMNRVLAPVKLKGSRQITQVFGHKLKTPRSVKTKERYPDVAAVYHANAHHGRVRQKFYVDAKKFKVLMNAKFARVGLLASGWSNAAQALDVAQPAWVARHGTGRGTYSENFSTPVMRLSAGNLAPGLPGKVRDELARRIPYAVKYVERGMIANIRHVTLKAAQEAGRKAAA